MFDIEKIKQGVVAAIASVILTATAVGAAVAPAETTSTVLFAQVQNGSLNG
jgi:hypothetical protein